MRKTLVSVIGAGAATPDERVLAEEVGRLIAEAGAVVVCGGLGGVMEAACLGAKKAGGLTLGFLPGESPESSNPHLDIALPTGMGEVRNALVARSGDGVVAVGGALGTLSELAFAIKKRLPVAAIGSWELNGRRLPPDVCFFEAETPSEAVGFVMRRIAERRAT